MTQPGGPALICPCRRCGARNRVAARFCWQCGYPLPAPDDASTAPLSLEAVRAALDGYLDLSAEVLAQVPPPLRPLLQQLATFRPILWRADMQITFVGAFKSGKSTLINALLGADILPTRVLRATGSTTRIGYSPQPHASITRHTPDGEPQRVPIPFDERARSILLNLDDGRDGGDGGGVVDEAGGGGDAAGTGAEGDEYIDLGIPLDLLRHGCTLVDTPGLMDEPELTARSLRELARSDLAVFVLSAYQLLSVREKEAVRAADRLLGGNIVFVVNQMDLVAEEDRADVLERARLVLRDVGNWLVGQPRIFALAALPAFAARMQPTPEQPDALASLHAFEQWLGELVHGSTRDQVTFRARLAILAHYLGQVRTRMTPHLQAAQQAEEAAQTAATAARASRQRAARRAIVEDGLRLSLLESRFDLLGEAFAQGCEQALKQRMATDPEWTGKLRACFDQTLQAYMDQVAWSASAALTTSELAAPAFTLSRAAQQRVDDAGEWIGNLGFWLGLMPGVTAPLELPPLPLLNEVAQAFAFVDDWFGQARHEVRQQILHEADTTVRLLLPLLRSESHRYLDEVRAALEQFSGPPDTAVPELQALAAAQETTRSYRDLAAWCAAFAAALANSQRGAASM